MIIKTFTIRSNARRAARAAGLDLDGLDFIQGADGRWTFAQRAALPPAIERTPVVSPDGGAAWRGLYEGTAPAAEPVEDVAPGPVAALVPTPIAAPSKGPRRGKSAALVAAASSPTGITNAEIKALTGWTKFGGFFDAVKRAGLQLRRVREDGDTRWFAGAPDGESAARAA